MPNLFFLFSPEVNPHVSSKLFRKISRKARQAVADTLGLELKQVTTYRLNVDDVDGEDVCGLQILCLASHSHKRLAKIDELKENIAQAMRQLYKDSKTVRKVFDLAGAESWAIMPFGDWMRITFGDQNEPNE